MLWVIFSVADEPEPFIPSIRINSPHYLCKIILNEASPRYLTLVVSQLEKQKTIYYTLRAYATCPFTLKKFPDNFRYTEKVNPKLLRLLYHSCTIACNDQVDYCFGREPTLSHDL